jgi:hypothetical protein
MAQKCDVELGAVHGVGAQRVAGVFPLAPQIAPQVSEIRKSWMFTASPISAELFRLFLPAGLSSRPRPNVGRKQSGGAHFLFYRSLD